MTGTRKAHWIKQNHQERMPPRMVAFDTESMSTYDSEVETQEWRTGCAIRWRTDTKASDHREARVFDTPLDFWSWVSDYTRPGTRTVVWAHNLGYDIRISRMFEILPSLGYHLEWCNLDRNISSATWRSDHGTIVLADTWTWIPLPLSVIAPHVGMVKYEMPSANAHPEDWSTYCMHDAEILYHVICTLIQFVKTEHLGNWQPTGAGMSYSAWRHRFMSDKVLVHDDVAALAAEREAMHTGRAEAWRHGEVYGEYWTEVDLKNAYVTVAANYAVPRKLHLHHEAISTAQYRRLCERFAVLCRVVISTDVECVPYRHGGRHLWPVGKFETWLWDVEVDQALKEGARVSIREAYTYVRSPVLQEWARWVLSILYTSDESLSGVVRTHVKHCARALIGRIAMRAPCWEYYGTNVDNWTGITHCTFPEEGRTARMLHVGSDTLIETERTEGKDSLPMITGWIMAKVRTTLWEAMRVCGEDNIAHVDTDSILCNRTGLSRLQHHYGDDFRLAWSIKGTFTRLEIYGPRAYFRDKERKTAGIPLKAEETKSGEFTAERWSSLGGDLERGESSTVTLSPAVYTLKRSDPRRGDATGVVGRTRPYLASELDSPNRSSAATNGDGE